MPFCTKCGAEVAENVSFCPKCGGNQQGGQNPIQSTEKKYSLAHLFLVGIVAAIVIFIILAVIGTYIDEDDDEDSTMVDTQEKGNAKSSGKTSSFKDSRDGKVYKTVKIGKQTWMAQNLDYHGEDGYFGLCSGDNPKRGIRKPENCEKYGRLYSWEEAMEACPKGWHLPTDKEWLKLVDFAGGSLVAGKKLKAKSGWKAECVYRYTDDRGRAIEDDTCLDEYGFSALPGGNGDSDGGANFVGYKGFWWSASEIEGSDMYVNCFVMGDLRKDALGVLTEVFGGGNLSSAVLGLPIIKFTTMLSVRCVK